MENTTNNKTDLTKIPKEAISAIESVYDQAIHQQQDQFQTGIGNLKTELEGLFQLRSRLTPVVGNRMSRFATKTD